MVLHHSNGVVHSSNGVVHNHNGVVHSHNGVANNSNGDLTHLQVLTLISHMVGVEIPHKVDQLEEVIAQATVGHHKQQHLKDGVVSHHNHLMVLDMGRSQSTVTVDQ